MEKLHKLRVFCKKLFTVRRIAYTIFLSILFIVGAVLFVGFSTRKNPILEKQSREQVNTKEGIVNDVTEINPVKVLGVVTPHTTDEIVVAVKNNDHVSIGGGRNSMGGQTASERAVQIDMREYNKILSFSTTTKEITVQAGIRWRDIQEYIDPHGLSIQIMQTYSNFTVGGSLSVNVHGRYVGLGPIILSVKKFHIVLADGSVVEASPEKNTDIFYSAIGGMGGIGVITDVTLSLADNVNVERVRVLMPTTQYADYFAKDIRSDDEVIFHNGDIYPPNFDRVSAVSWVKTDKEVTVEEKLIPQVKDYWKERIAWVVMSEWPAGRWMREHIIDPLMYWGTAPVHTRNYEASYDVAELEPKMRDQSTYVLQEYFVPVENFDGWIPKMKKVFTDNDVNVINVSIRHALPDPGTKLAWAKKESFAFVVYYKQGVDERSKNKVTTWTRQMIDEVLSVGGTYYLPYQLQATNSQFQRAYPGSVEYFEIKKEYDPNNKFTNKLWDTYYSEEKIISNTLFQKEYALASTTKEYYRPFDNAYLALPEWYIVYSADQYATVLKDGLPSQFHYFKGITEYWKQYNKVTALVATSTTNNSDYVTVLKVIGVSYSLENSIKGIYENTIGRAFEWIAGGIHTPEDTYAALAAQDYATFIYDYPWYDFPYGTYFKKVWSLHSDTSYTWLQNIRRVERKIFLSFEFGIKTVYARIIGYATHTKFGVQDDIVSALITKDDGKTYEMIQGAHYQPFTRVLLYELSEQVDNPQFYVVDIAGNKRITFTYRDSVGASVVEGSTEIVRDTQEEGVDRITVEVSVRDIVNVYRQLKKNGILIDHFYDY